MVDLGRDVEDGMPRPPSDTVQVAIRIPADWLGEADRLAALISRPGFVASRTDALRAAMARGFESLRAELAPEAPTRSAAKQRPKTK